MSTTPLEVLTHGLSPADLGERVMVTGASGFVGRRLVEALVHLGVRVRAVDLAPWSGPPSPLVESVLCDITHVDGIIEATKGADAVFHTAARIALHGMGPAHVNEAIERVNVGGTKAVLVAAEAAGVERLVYTSSHNVVLGKEPLVEVSEEDCSYVTEFIDVYTPSKVAAEQAVLESDTPGGLRTCALRPGGVWGKGGIMLASVLEQLLAGSLVAFPGHPDILLDQTHVDNLVRAELLAMAGLSRAPERVGGEAYFITDDERLNGMSWFEPMIRDLGYPVPTRWIPRTPLYAVGWLLELVYRLGGPQPTITRASIHKITCSSALRVDKAREHLGWEPLVKRDEGLAALAQWLREEHDRMAAAKGKRRS